MVRVPAEGLRMVCRDKADCCPLSLCPDPPCRCTPARGCPRGDTVTLRCHLPQPAAWVELYQDGLLRSYKDMDKHQVMAEFSLVCVKLEDAMKYWCQYRVLEPPGVSEKSFPSNWW